MSDFPLGATPLPGSGVHFKLWAPNADQVDVLVQPNEPSWNPAGPMLRRTLTLMPDGYWEGSVPGATVASVYRYEITNGPRRFQRLDPASRDTLHSFNNLGLADNLNASIVVSDLAYPWSEYTAPAFSDFIIYQFHVGSFAGRGDGLDKPVATFRDAVAKLDYIRALDFNAVELLPVQEFAAERSWGYNPALFFAPESAYGSPRDLQDFVDAAHRRGLAVIFDVVYNHAGPQDNSLWQFDGFTDNGGIYFEGGQPTPWGLGPAWYKPEVRQFFYENAVMYFDCYHADGLRFDATTFMNGNDLAIIIARLKAEYPGKYIVAEHLPDHPWITTIGNFDATWCEAHHEFQRAMTGSDPVGRVRGFAGWDGYAEPWQQVKYLLGSHDDIGDQNSGDAEDGLTNADRRHRYFVDHFGGRENWFARAKCRLGWALNVGIAGTPLCFMGSECLMGAPSAAWGYWHDGPDIRGDHRFDWAMADDDHGRAMQQLTRDCNRLRTGIPALRAPGLDIPHDDRFNGVIGIKRWDAASGDVVLVTANMGDTDFTARNYGVSTGGQPGQWTQILCTQDAAYGGWDGAGNAFHEPFTQPDGRIYINLPKWSVVMFRLKT